MWVNVQSDPFSAKNLISRKTVALIYMNISQFYCLLKELISLKIPSNYKNIHTALIHIEKQLFFYYDTA